MSPIPVSEGPEIYIMANTLVLRWVAYWVKIDSYYEVNGVENIEDHSSEKKG